VKRDFLMLAHTWKGSDVSGWYMSEKLDGMRCFWDGGITRGIRKSEIAWANHDKDARYIDPPVATGLWTRLGNVIHAPDSWLDLLPAVSLDGELYGLGSRQALMSCVKSLVPDESLWVDVSYRIIDSPPLEIVLGAGLVRYGATAVTFPGYHGVETGIRAPFSSVYDRLPYAIPQTKLPGSPGLAKSVVLDALDMVSGCGGEGLMLRRPGSYYTPGRSHSLLKVKKLSDMEGTVIGYTTGALTDRGSKLLGMMGALILRLDSGVTLELSGFTEAERVLNDSLWAAAHPGERCSSSVYCPCFPMGSRVTFRYRGVSRDGVPNEARYWRKSDD